MGTTTLTDTEALTAIAALRGTSPEWNSAADYLEDIANIIASADRQHPGDADPDTYDPHRRSTV
jgi:hypothetical protein